MYLADILVTGVTTEKHLENVDAVLSKLEDTGLHLIPDKCTLMQPCIEYLDHLLMKKGVIRLTKKSRQLGKHHHPRT